MAHKDETIASEVISRLGPEEAASLVAQLDIVITTAQIPGRPAPLLVTRAMVEDMKPGSVVVDLAAPGGGNCELTQAGETVEHNAVKILGPTNLPISAADRREMYYPVQVPTLGLTLSLIHI